MVQPCRSRGGFNRIPQNMQALVRRNCAGASGAAASLPTGGPITRAVRYMLQALDCLREFGDQSLRVA